MEFCLDREKLEMYQVAIQFVAWSEILLEECMGQAPARPG
jgi:hypothetical protein